MRTTTASSTSVRHARRLGERLAQITRAGASALGSLSGRELQVDIGTVDVRTGAQLFAHVAQPLLLLRYRLTGDRGELGFLLGRREAVTLACLTRIGITDEEILERRLAAVPSANDLEGVQDVAWLFAERGDRVVRAFTGGRVGLGLEEVASLTTSNVEQVVPPDREFAVLRARLLLERVPPTDLAILVEPRAHDLLDADDPVARARGDGPSGSEPAVEHPPVQCGTALHAFLTDEATAEVARRCCTRLGLELIHHPGSTAPNPSVIRDGMVVLDVPTGFDRRFDWCLRLKQARPSVPIVLLIEHPSRGRVLRGFEARADVVLGSPTDPLELALRLRKLLAQPR